MPGTYLIWLEAPEVAANARPGQFLMVRCGDYLLPRPLSIHQRDNGKLALLLAVVGKGSHWLSQRPAGDALDLLGPLGNGFQIQPASRHLLLVAGGIGIAPLRYLAQETLEQGLSVTLLLGAPTATQLYPRRLLPHEVNLDMTTEDGTAGKKGMLTDLLPDFANLADQVFTCGPLPMYRNMYSQRTKLLGTKPTQVSLEVRMGCGLGVCYGCTVKTKSGQKQVCIDGPVFSLDDIIWDEVRC